MDWIKMHWLEWGWGKGSERDLGSIIVVSVPVSAQISDKQVLAGVNTH